MASSEDAMLRGNVKIQLSRLHLLVVAGGQGAAEAREMCRTIVGGGDGRRRCPLDDGVPA